MFKSKIFKQLAFLFFIVVAVALSIFAVFMLDTLNEHSMTEIRDKMSQNTKNIQFYLTGKYPARLQTSTELTESVQGISRVNKLDIYILDNRGQLIAASNSDDRVLTLLENDTKKPKDSSKIGLHTRKDIVQNDNYIFAATVLALGNADYTLITVSRLQDLSGNLYHVRHLTFLGLIIAYILAFIISIKAARNFTAPIISLTAAAEEYAGGSFERKLLVKSDDEFSALAYSLNNLANSLADKIKETSMEKRKLELILEQMDNAVMLIDTAGFIQTLNRRALDIFPINTAALSNLHSIEILGSAYFEKALRDTLRKNVPGTIDLKLKIREIPKNFRVFLSPISEVYSNIPKYVLCVFYDVTALMSIYDKQVEFVANASHELRTPLTSIRGFAETIEDVAEQPELVTKFSKTIQEEALRMQRLVFDLLQLAKLDSLEYRHSIALADTNIQKLLPDICEEMSRQAREKNITLEYFAEPSLREIYTNYDWLKQALVNLAENAIKYTLPGGKVILGVKADGQNVKFTVKDNGPGMPDSDLKKIFERFYRLDSARNRSTGGTGLGLSIVRFIVQLLGANIKVESQIDVGTTFTIIIPQQNPEK